MTVEDGEFTGIITTGSNKARSPPGERDEEDAGIESPQAEEGEGEGEGTTISAKFGRPKGSTDSFAREFRARIELAKVLCVKNLKAMDERRRSEGRVGRLANGTLESIISSAKETYSLPPEKNISVECIRTRFKRGCEAPKVNQGTPSPMLGVEPYLVELIIQLGRIRCPINVTTGLHLANSLIAGTPLADEILKWKMKHNAPTRHVVAKSAGIESDTSDCSILGWGYWYKFIKRNGHLVKSSKGVKFESKRAQWCVYENFVSMYDGIYHEMACSGIANELATPVFLNKEGEIVETKEESFGLPTKYIISRPDKLLFVDEVGSNTSTTKDGNVGGEKFLCEASARPQIKAATKDAHFTVLGFTAATGEPVMCAIIFAAKVLSPSWVLGYDASAEWLGGEDDTDLNSGGLGKSFPMGPQCNFKGVDVPCLCCCSENGSITAELLVAMLKTMDSFNLFDRSDGVPPFLILDGHGSRFDVTFLEYINNDDTKWNVCIGLPYGTSYWQVGDSSEQNGCFKMALTKYKRDLLRRKELVDQEFAIEKDDVVGLVSRAWQDSFARVRTNKNAIAERGWTPLNYNCLLHPEVATTKFKGVINNDIMMQPPAVTDLGIDSTASTALTVQPELLNLSNGLAASLFDTLMDTKARNDARNGINREEVQRKRRETSLEDMRLRKKRYSAGLHVAAGKHRLGPDLLTEMRERANIKAATESKVQENRLKAFRALRSKVVAIRASGRSDEQLTVAQLKVMISWYKLPTDLTIPHQTKESLLQRLQLTSSRNDPHEPALPALVLPQDEAVQEQEEAQHEVHVPDGD